MIEELPPLGLLVGLAAVLGFVTFFVVMATSFVKVAVVLFILRNALGIQQTPPNLVLYSISITLALFISAPVFSEMARIVQTLSPGLDGIGDWLAALPEVTRPVADFLARFSSEADRAFFVAAASRVWPEGQGPEMAPDSLGVLLPAFMMSELTAAFQIGLLVYLPFVVIDLVVTSVLMAMGMAQVTPALISTPFKLFVFVAVDGWSLVLHGLVLSYAVV